MTISFSQVLPILTGVLVLWVGILSYQLWMLKRRYKGVTEALEEGKLADAVVRLGEEFKYLQNKKNSLDEAHAKTVEVLKGAIQKVGIVRYDAFDDVGGKISYSIALLDAKESGIVLSTINGRQESRSYAKPIIEGKSPHNLSGEEEKAIAKALEKMP